MLLSSFSRLVKSPALGRAFTASTARNAMVDVHSDSAGVFNIVLNRDEGKNSLSKAMLAEFNAAVKSVSADKAARVVIISSNVPKVFCAGADLKERATMPESQIADFVAQLRDAFQAVANIPVPVIAAIDGAALGGGLELALACDLRVASENSIIGLPETALAIIPGAGGTQRLPRLLGAAKAKELIFLAKRMNGLEAKNIGLVTEYVSAAAVAASPGAVLAKAKEMAEVMCTHGPVGMRMAKRAIDEGMRGDLAHGLSEEKAAYANTVPTKDRVEGLQAFKEKRKPVYIGA
jgi:methylglutaconyl-CoA hydratase